MAYKTFETRDSFVQEASSEDNKTIHLGADDQKSIDLPNADFVHDSQIIRDGSDLILKAENGETVIIDDYYTQNNPPNLIAPDGTTLTPNLVHSFARSELQFAQAAGKNDASPIGSVQEIKGEASVTRLDGTVETIGIGTPIYAGDIIETSEEGAVNIIFMDETTFAVSNDAKLAIDEYVFDPNTQSGETNFSVLKGMFVFTSGLIGRDDPDDVHINTPSGSIGIRGTIIAGNVDTGEITVIEGAIVLNDFNGNSITLSNQYETARFNTSGGTIEHVGELTANDISSKFSGVSHVSGDLFSTIQDKANEAGTGNEQNNETQQNTAPQNTPTTTEATEGTEDHSALQPLQNFLTSQDIAFAGDEFKILQPLQTIQTIAENRDGTVTNSAPLLNAIGDTTMLKPLLGMDNADKLPFAITITKLAFSENAGTSSPVAVIKGFFTPETKLVLNDISNNFYQATRVDENTFEITLKSGLQIDAERAPPLRFTAENASGAAIISDSIKLDVLDVNETTTIAHNPANQLFEASSGNNWSYNFLNDFRDPEGDIASFSYNFTGFPTAFANSNAADGSSFLNINFSTIPSNGSFDITINALDSDGGILQSFTKTFYYYNQDLVMTGGSYDNNGYDILTSYGPGAQTVDVMYGNNDRIFTNNGDDTISVTGNNGTLIHAGNGDDEINIYAGVGNFAFGEDGDDEFNILDSGNYACGGDGQDTFTISADGNETYGGNNSDTFIISSASLLSTTTTRIDGQSGRDTLEISSGGSINFSSFDANVVRNIENISTNNGNTDVITLSRSDVLDMTDQNKTLAITMDSHDTLNFTNDSGGTMNFYHLGEVGGRDVYSDGIITLLISAEGSHNAIV